MSLTIQSLDPRVTRAGIPADQETPFDKLEELDQLETYEVFHQDKRGAQPVHVGSLHASSPEIALVFAKEQYGRRGRSVSIWVVKTRDIYTIGAEEENLFATIQEKDYREARGYRVGGKLTAFKRARAEESRENG